MKTVQGMPITASKTFQSKKRPFVPNAKDTSSDEERMIKEPPAPFKNNMTAAQMPATHGARGAVPGNGPRVRVGMKPSSSPGVKALPSGGAVGYKRLPNQSGQMNGRMGTSFPRKIGAQNLSKVKRNASFYGE